MIRKYRRIVYWRGNKYFFRFSWHQRLQHIVLFSCVITLSLTGFPVKYAEKSWAPALYNFFGGIDIAPTVHRVAGSVLLILFVYHTTYWMVLFFRNRVKQLHGEKKLGVKSFVVALLTQQMMPNLQDGKDLIEHLKYLLYLKDKPPKYGYMSWKEKFDYIAPYWGIPILGPAGVVLWQRDFFSHYLPGVFFNISYILHTDEALLAAMFLFGVHWYNVHYSPEKFPMATVFLTGYLSENEMMHEHYGEYEEAMTEEGLEAEIKPQH